VRAGARVIALAALADVLAARAGAAELVVQWAPLAAPVEAYQVERSAEGDAERFAPVARVPGNATRFTDRDVRPGVRYCYRVRGVRGERVSPPSPPLCNVASEPAPAREPTRPEVRISDSSSDVDSATTPDADTDAAVLEPNPGGAPESTPRTSARPALGQTREVRALRRPPPAYPMQAQLDGLSGWVKVSFTVTADGSTRDVRVVASEPPGVFDAAAIEAAKRFLYAPRLENGVAVDRPNVETEFTFTWVERSGSLIKGRPARR
jgi:protein TonB